ncbi:glycine N-acyltransferase-like protein 2 [Bos indicus]|uniref:Glycine N-acyltransferase-like protein n=3 Tax=Bos TaxID=9903 RepID=E1B7T8_BOVIN|nr:glycine N-acyltransferase-like protein 2 [Bos taurus]XP_010811238.1 glycine N-acyltransferase-like protein 2 isoform X1 [Bos taurus]XP_019830356.1 PREDICTED: glycine N-acyltransferase-like protein 2 [Bos indicus]XP_027417631.1 glycine N-acyltransferase-like protein 2 [Bos indicus x Bos taurus]DAA21609.1 TPA: glycine-N-acyltransferase-like 2-like [Bos taurus]
MFVLREPQQLQILYESLEESIPESLKVYGTLFHIRNKNPFNLEVLVDAWPEYQTVVIRPQKEEMKDDLDYYTNTYHIFTKAPDKLEEVLACPQVINWEQAFQIQGCQESLGEAIQKVAASKSVQVDYLRTVLFVFEKPTLEASSGDKMDLMKLLKIPKVLEDKRKETFQNIFLDVSHARLVNEHWELGKNEKSLKYVERCLQNFAGFGVLSSEGKPISWFLTEQSCEIRMGYTFPKYRGQGHMWQMGCHSIAYFFSKKIPFYIHAAEDKEKTQQTLLSFGFKNVLCGWHQWKCTPKKYC